MKWSPESLHNLVPNCLCFNFIAFIPSSAPPSPPLYSSIVSCSSQTCRVFVSPGLGSHASFCFQSCFPHCVSGKLNSPFKIQLKCHLPCEDHHPHLPQAKLMTLCAATCFMSLCNIVLSILPVCVCPLLMPSDYLRAVTVSSVFPVTNKVLDTYHRFPHAQ